MNDRPLMHLRLPTLLVAGLLAIAGQSASAAPASTLYSVTNGLSMATSPLFVSGNIAPIVMLNVTKDHQLYYKAYNDYTDLDGDGGLEITYKHSFNYYGYFDHTKCYTYDASAGYFKPTRVTADKYCTASSNEWSGNFLNWVSMSRIDVLRKVLYGGSRFFDDAASSGNFGRTVLERSLIPTDAHAWAKFYDGNDINKLTPFSNVPNTPAVVTTGTTPSVWGLSSNNTVCGTECSVDVWMSNTAGLDVEVGDQVTVTSPSGNRVWKGMVHFIKPNESVVLRIPGSSFAGGACSYFKDTGYNNCGESGNWTVTNNTRRGLTFCNVTYASGDSANSHSLSTASNPPLIRVVRGDYALWAANERTQCLYSSERGDTLNVVTENNNTYSFSKNNGNRIGLSGLASSAKNPPTTRGLFNAISSTGKPDYNARVQVCVSEALLGSESCRGYGSPMTLKPIGLLQEFGEGDAPSMRFGLITGSYDQNISGGVLRRGARASLSKTGYADNEINPADGTFIKQANVNSRGIIETLDRLRLYGYQYFGGSLTDGYMNLDGCNYQQMGMVLSGGGGSGLPANQGNCSTWGNPMGEMYMESLRYLAGETTPTTGFATNNVKDAALGLPRDTWSDPVIAGEWCTPLTTLVVNSSSTSYDHDQYGSYASYIGAATDGVGSGENLNSTSVAVGTVNGVGDSQCTAKTLGTLSQAQGICPEAPALQGTYNIAGMAWRARTNKIRTWPNVTDANAGLVSTYAVQLSSSTPRIELQVGGKPVVISPAYRLVRDGRVGGGTIVDFRPVSVTTTKGDFYIAWEDSSAGADYDQDVWGILSYEITGSTIKVTTRVVSEATTHPQGFGYTIQGTTKDGAHFHSGIEGFNYDDPVNIFSNLTINGAAANTSLHQINSSGGCSNCQAGAPASTASYSVDGNSGITELKDPLFYAAKWGGFTRAKGTTAVVTTTTTPNSTGMVWDAVVNATGNAGTDGVPDNYYYVINPIRLQDSLRQAFLSILAKGASAGVAANSYSLSSDSAVYLAGFKTDFWSGWIQAIRLNSDGTLADSPLWTTDTTMAPGAINATQRVVYTRGAAGDGYEFQWLNLSAAQQTALNAGDGKGLDRLNYLRGDISKEKTQFRERPQSLLGDIVNSSPIYVGRPTGRYDYPVNLFNEVYTTDNSYDLWRNSKSSRAPMVYVGANDGMLHGFDANTGVEKLAYVPSVAYSKLASLTSPSYVHQYLVDGAPTVADVKFNTGGWKSVLVGGAGAGGRGYFALDVSDAANFTANRAADNVLWEFTNKDDSDLGYAVSRPLIVKLNNGKWAAIVGNGYFNNGDQVATGTARIYVLYIEDGATATAASTAASPNVWSEGQNYIVLDTKAGSPTAPNGIGQIVAFDSNLDGIADEIYGGDLKGNLWKFDLSSSQSNSWKVAYGTNNNPRPLVTVCNDASSQSACLASLLPITLRPTVTFHPETDNSKMVYFGTGKYLETADQSTTGKGWVFGVWDNGAALGRLDEIGTNGMLTQTISLKPDANGNSIAGVREVTNLAPNWSVHKLWREQLPSPGERMTGTPRLLGGILFYTTYVPSTSLCSQKGTGWLMGVRFQNGGQATYQLFDTNGQNGVTEQDVTSAGIAVDPTLGDVALIKTEGRGTVTAVLQTTSGEGTTEEPKPRWPQSRVSWRELSRD